MKLMEWLRSTETSVEDLAEGLDCSIYAIRKWLRGERVPRPAMQVKIKKYTKGAIGADDWWPE